MQLQDDQVGDGGGGRRVVRLKKDVAAKVTL